MSGLAGQITCLRRQGSARLKKKWSSVANMEHGKSKLEDTHGLYKICCHEPGEKKVGADSKEGSRPKKSYLFLGISIVVASVIIGGTWIYTVQLKNINPAIANAKIIAGLEKIVLPENGVVLPVTWGDLEKQLVDNGTIDPTKFEALYDQRGIFDEETKKLLTGNDNNRLVIGKNNANAVLNLLWALGLANKNEILEKGPMVDKKYGGNAGNFASTGGWTLAVGNTMNHYSNHTMISLTPEQQSSVERVSQNIYRPCCGNSVYFPDCNHGMAMLGLLELMASQGVNESNMYKAALVVNSYWFPDTYLNIAQYLKSKKIEWNKVDPKEILGAKFSSASGYQQILNQIQPASNGKGPSCGV